MYSETLLNHFDAPRNVGEPSTISASATEENPICGDILTVFLRIEDGTVSEMRWRAEGCAPTIAAASVTSELVKGMSLDSARGLTKNVIADALGGLPPRKAHAALLAVSAVRRAIDEYVLQCNSTDPQSGQSGTQVSMEHAHVSKVSEG